MVAKYRRKTSTSSVMFVRVLELDLFTGHLSWQQFAELIDVCESSIQARGWVE